MSQTPKMTPDRFSELADAYGGALERWPGDVQAAARAFAEAEPDFSQACLDEAGALDRLLDLDAVSPPAAELFETIAASGLRRAYAPPRWAGLAAAVALMFGAGSGWVGAQMSAEPEDPVFYASAFSVLSETETLFEDAS